MRNRSGFSIIELLIVIMLIGIVSSSIYGTMYVFMNKWNRDQSIISTERTLFSTSREIYDDLVLADQIVKVSNSPFCIKFYKKNYINKIGVVRELVTYYLYRYPGEKEGSSLMRAKGTFDLIDNYGKGSVRIDRDLDEKKTFVGIDDNGLITYVLAAKKQGMPLEVISKVHTGYARSSN